MVSLAISTDVGPHATKGLQSSRSTKKKVFELSVEFKQKRE
jgi:hypothetical protein